MGLAVLFHVRLLSGASIVLNYPSLHMFSTDLLECC